MQLKDYVPGRSRSRASTIEWINETTGVNSEDVRTVLDALVKLVTLDLANPPFCYSFEPIFFAKTQILPEKPERMGGTFRKGVKKLCCAVPARAVVTLREMPAYKEML